MTIALALLILAAPFAVAAGLGWVAHRTGIFRFTFSQFQVAGPMSGRYFGHDRDAFRIGHDVDAIRTRFERQPFWPASGSLSERR